MPGPDVVVVGSGPNGLTAAARAVLSGRSVVVYESAGEIGGGARTAEMTLPGFRHDVCSAIHPFGVVSPAFSGLGLDIAWITPPIAVSHPLDGGRAAALFNGVAETAASLPAGDGRVWRELVGPIVDDLESVMSTFLSARIIPNPLSAGERALTIAGARSADALAGRFESNEARALVAGLAAHSVAPLTSPFTAGVALLMAAVGNGVGWPIAPGGSAAITDALAGLITEHGGELVTGQTVTSLEGLADSTVFLDTSPADARVIGRTRMNPTDIVGFGRWKPGPGTFKIDYALDGPMPWADPLSAVAGTVHVGGTFEEVAEAEALVGRGGHPAHPFVIYAQQSDFDPHRAPEGRRTGWAYCHVPNGSDVDMTDAIETQLDRFAPGFRDLVLARHVTRPSDFESYNANYVGGDIGGGRFSVKRFFPKLKSPYRVGDRLYVCSSATPPGGGAHGMCGWNAADGAFGPMVTRTPTRPVD